MKKKGFTLVELLAVIIILAVIALIATPIVLNVVESSKKSAFESSVYGIIDTIELEVADKMLKGENLEYEYNFPTDDLEVQGTQPTGGIAKVDSKGKISIAAHNGEWCVIKGYDDESVTIDKIMGNCTLPIEVEPIVWHVGTDVTDFVTATDADGNVFAYKISDYSYGIETLEGVEMDANGYGILLSANDNTLAQKTENMYTVAEEIIICQTSSCEYNGITYPEAGAYVTTEIVNFTSLSIGSKLGHFVTDAVIAWDGNSYGLECIEYGSFTDDSFNVYCKVSDEIPSTNPSAYTTVFSMNNNGEIEIRTNDSANLVTTYDDTLMLISLAGMIVLDDNNNSPVEGMTKGVWFVKQIFSDGTANYISALYFDKNIK